MKARAGVALVAALVAIVLIAVLVSGALFAVNQEAQATAAELIDRQTSAYAERAAVLTIANWSCGECDLMTPGNVIVRTPIADYPLESTVYVTRLDSALFLVTGEARLIAGNAIKLRRRVSIVVKTSRDSTNVSRAMRVSEQAWSATFLM